MMQKYAPEGLGKQKPGMRRGSTRLEKLLEGNFRD